MCKCFVCTTTATNPNPKQPDLQVCRKRAREGHVRTGSGGAGNEQADKGDGSGGYDGGDPRSDVETGGHRTSMHPLKQAWHEEGLWRPGVKVN